MKIVNRLLLALHLFIGIGGICGGLAAILDPINPLGATLDVLERSPFSNFLIPGIILFAVIGIGNIVSAYFLIRHKLKYQGYISSVFSWALVIWIIVQCIMLNTIMFVQVLCFSIGLIMAVLSLILVFEQRLFPANIVLSFVAKTERNISTK